jgi:hypothetical protein
VAGRAAREKIASGLPKVSVDRIGNSDEQDVSDQTTMAATTSTKLSTITATRSTSVKPRCGHPLAASVVTVVVAADCD